MTGLCLYCPWEQKLREPVFMWKGVDEIYILKYIRRWHRNRMWELAKDTGQKWDVWKFWNRMRRWLFCRCRYCHWVYLDLVDIGIDELQCVVGNVPVENEWDPEAWWEVKGWEERWPRCVGSCRVDSLRVWKKTLSFWRRRSNWSKGDVADSMAHWKCFRI